MSTYVDGQLIDGSHQFNPLDGNGESVDLGLVEHCQTIEAHIRNYIATQGDIQLTIDVANLRDS